MKTIWKFPLQLVERQVISVRRGSNPLTVQLQKGEICLWIEIDTERSVQPMTLRIVGTGRPIPEGMLDYIGTVQMLPYVWHIYEEVPEEEDILPDGGDLA